MFYKYQSHSLTDLAHKLSELTAAQDSNPMQPTWIVVQNNEVKEWLSLQVAEQNGISGNIKFIFPSEFIWMIYRLKHTEVPQALPSDLNALQWTLFELFGESREILDDIPHIKGTEVSKSRRFQLAGQIADVFDQYQVYRPDMISSWKEGRLITRQSDEQWQLKLWRTLEEYWAAKSKTENIPTRALAHQRVKNWLDNGDNDLLIGLPEHIFVFGLSHISQPFMEVLTRISGYKKVHFFNRNIELKSISQECKELFDGWNAPHQGQNQLLNELVKECGYEVAEYEVGKHKDELKHIEIHSCHGVRRELEVLKDEILHFLDQHPHLKASDILILVPDAEQYAPLLEAHFSEINDAEGHNLPLTRLHWKQSQLNEHSLLSLLDLLNSSFKPSSVIDVISLEPVKKRFDFSDDDIDLLEVWIRSNRVFRGLGDSFNDAFSWQKGINQLITGAVMSPDHLESFKGLVPVVELSASDEMNLAAKFSSFIHALKSVAEETRENKTPEQWLFLVEQMCKTLIIDPENEDKEPSIYRTISRIKEHIAYTEGKEVVPFSLFRNWLKGRITASNSSSGRFGQGITVSTYIPYRSVPFNFIAVLGLNEGVFPRRSVRPEFDLIYKEPRTGDRILSEDDTYLFYEILSSARDHLHISYKGQDLKSEMDRLPSMLVQQLKESLPEDQITLTRHRLHAFNPGYFLEEHGKQGQKLRKSYDDKQKAVADKIRNSLNKTADFRLDKIDSPEIFKVKNLAIHDLISFYTHPANYMLKNELGVNYSINMDEVQDREKFKLKGLDKYKVDDLLYVSIQQEVSDSQIFDYVTKAGYIPSMLKGKKAFDIEYDKPLGLLNEVSQFTKKDDQSFALRFTYKGVQIYGNVNGLYGNSLVLHRVGQRRESHEIEQWLLHNALLAGGYPIKESYYLSFDKNNAIEVNRINSRAIDENLFENLLEWYLGDSSILDKMNFFPKTSKTYTEVLLKTEDEEKALNKALAAYTPSNYNKYAEGAEESNIVVWRNLNPFMRSSFSKNALLFWKPYLKALEDSNE